MLNFINDNENIHRLQNKIARLEEELKFYRQQHKVKRGDIVIFKADNIIDRGIQSSARPHVVVSNDVGNYHSNICLVVPMTSQAKKLTLPTHFVSSYNNSVVLCEQIKTIRQDEILKTCGRLGEDEMKTINNCLKVSLGIEG